MSLVDRMSDVLNKATCVFTKAEVEAALDRVAEEMHNKLKDSDPVFLCVLLGGIVPLGNLLPRLNFHLEINYIHVSSYAGKTSAGEMHWKAEPTISLSGRTVVVVDDILDTGITLKTAKDYCIEHGAKEVYTCVLLNKNKPRKPGGLEVADFKALSMDDRYVFGYGLDYAEYLRNVPGIYSVAEEHM